VVTLLRNMHIDPTDLVEALEEDLRGLSDTTSEGGYMPLGPVLHEVVDEIEDRRQQGGKLRGISTGLVGLDGMLGGLMPGSHIIAAPTADGKTALALTLANHAASNGATVAIHSLEMSRSALILRLLAMKTGIDAFRMGQGDLTENEWQKISRALSDLDAMALYIDDSSTISPMQMHARALRLHRSEGLDLLVSLVLRMD